MAKTNNPQDINAFIDHTLLSPVLQKSQIDQVCEEAISYEFAGICIPPFYVQHSSNLLNNSKVKLVTVIGFPLGYNKITTKAEEARKAIDDGADELDMVLNLTAFKSDLTSYVKDDIESVITLSRLNNKIVKVIIETGLLNEDEIVKACQICADCNVDYVKTCTGFNGGKAEVDHIRLMRETLPNHIKIKASGGIKNSGDAWNLIHAGADRLGTSSAIKIIANEKG